MTRNTLEHSPRLPRRLWAPVLAAVAAIGVGGGAAVAAVGDQGSQGPAPDTIVQVEGDAGNGFGIYYYDGSAIYPPTDSEARAECSEYDTVKQRVRCRTEVRTWYRDLADLQQALEWANRPAA